MSVTRRKYIVRLIGRIVVLCICAGLCFLKPESFDILDGMNFFKRISPFHLLWVIWMIDMVFQLMPVHKKLHTIALGSQKLFASRFLPIREKIHSKALSKHILSTTRAAYKVMLIWGGLTILLGVLHFLGIIGKTGMFMISVFFYVCDLICVLVWCPFRLIMKNKCCTTCRIFNWDHLMMFLPLIFVGGFYAVSLVVMAFAAWLVWELCVLAYPERFCEMTNAALKCSECTDKLCTQYCKKLR